MRPLCVWGSASAVWSLLFASMHFFWVYAYFSWPAAGRVMLGPAFEQAFSSPGFRAYDLAVGALFVATGLAALTTVREEDPTHGRIIRRCLWIATAAFTVRGAAGALLDILIILHVLPGSSSRAMLYDFWFLLGGILFMGTLRQQKRAGLLHA